MKKSKNGYTLIEVVLVVALIVIIASAFTAGLSKYIDGANTNADVVKIQAKAYDNAIIAARGRLADSTWEMPEVEDDEEEVAEGPTLPGGNSLGEEEDKTIEGDGKEVTSGDEKNEGGSEIIISGEGDKSDEGDKTSEEEKSNEEDKTVNSEEGSQSAPEADKSVPTSAPGCSTSNITVYYKGNSNSGANGAFTINFPKGASEITVFLPKGYTVPDYVDWRYDREITKDGDVKLTIKSGIDSGNFTDNLTISWNYGTELPPEGVPEGAFTVISVKK